MSHSLGLESKIWYFQPEMYAYLKGQNKIGHDGKIGKSKPASNLIIVKLLYTYINYRIYYNKDSK